MICSGDKKCDCPKCNPKPKPAKKAHPWRKTFRKPTKSVYQVGISGGDQ